MYTKAIEIRRHVQPESHADIKSIVSMRDSLQELIENYPEEMIDYDWSSDDEHMFHSIKEAFDYGRTQMEIE
ncbi:unnamed protein product [Rotaria sp. Silwood2]|nr:unnamed protein product [Rotaria sp. Silwood2]